SVADPPPPQPAPISLAIGVGRSGPSEEEGREARGEGPVGCSSRTVTAGACAPSIMIVAACAPNAAIAGACISAFREGGPVGRQNPRLQKSRTAVGCGLARRPVRSGSARDAEARSPDRESPYRSALEPLHRPCEWRPRRYPECSRKFRETRSE